MKNQRLKGKETSLLKYRTKRVVRFFIQISVIGLIQVYALNGALGKHEKRSFIKVAISLMKLDLPWSSAMYERKRKYKKSFIRFVLLKMNFHSRVVPSKVARLLN